MEHLILDIKINIAEKDREVWWLFYLYFDDFKNYTREYTSHYCRLFTKMIRLNQSTHYYYLNTIYVKCDTGVERWYNDDKDRKLHRHGGPAVINCYGEQWYQHGQLHRDDGPAVISCEGNQYWYQHGERHNDQGPAIIKNGRQEWYQHGKRHNDQGPAIISKEGNQEWYQNGLLHRDGGPAVIYVSGWKEWYQHGVKIDPDFIF